MGDSVFLQPVPLLPGRPAVGEARVPRALPARLRGGQAVEGDATVVFVMNHRSNLDYVILAYLI
jgi:1-acyl-sn-glycerol-3-phosphate acyltransferase